MRIRTIIRVARNFVAVSLDMHYVLTSLLSYLLISSTVMLAVDAKPARTRTRKTTDHRHASTSPRLFFDTETSTLTSRNTVTPPLRDGDVVIRRAHRHRHQGQLEAHRSSRQLHRQEMLSRSLDELQRMFAESLDVQQAPAAETNPVDTDGEQSSPYGYEIVPSSSANALQYEPTRSSRRRGASEEVDDDDGERVQFVPKVRIEKEHRGHHGTARRTSSSADLFSPFGGRGSLGRAANDHHGECPKQNGRHSFACPSRHHRGYVVCIYDRDLCDGTAHCPGKEDEDPSNCLFYKMFHRYFKMIMDSLTELNDVVTANDADSHSEL